MYVPSDNITIDGELVAFEGRYTFKIYIPSFYKYGIKNIMTHGTRTAFELDTEIYIGKGSRTFNIPVAQYHYGRLTSSIQRTYTLDNWFTWVDTK